MVEGSKDATLLRDLIQIPLLLVEEKEKKAPASGGFEPGTSRLRDRCSNHFTT